MTRLTDIFAGAGSTQAMEKAVGSFREELFQPAGSEGTVRRMTGAFVSKNRMKGDVVRGAEVLAPWEAYAPGFKEGTHASPTTFTSTSARRG